MAKLRGDDDLMSLMDELSSQQGYEKDVPKEEPKALPAQATETLESTNVPTQWRRLRPEIASYPSNKPGGSRRIWNPYVKVIPSNSNQRPLLVPTNPQVEVFRRRAYEKFKGEFKQIFERARGNSTKEGVSNLWTELLVVSLMERWHFAVKLRETLDANQSQRSPKKLSPSKSISCLEWDMQKVQAYMVEANKQGWVDPMLIVDSNDRSNKNQRPQGPQANLLADEIKFDWLRAWRKAVNGKHQDGDVEGVFTSKQFKKKINGLSCAVKAAGYEAIDTFNKEIVKKARMEAMQTNRKRRNIPKMLQQEDDVLVSYSGLSFSINNDHFQKLQIMFDRQNRSSLSREDHEAAFISSLFTLLARYDMLQGAGLQSAVQGAVFDVLLKHYGCNMECFASPLNCRYERFLSAFPDTDLTFGSLGSFFDYDFTQGGAYQANPPFVADFIHAMQKKMDDSLDQCTKPLLYIVFVPAWVDTSAWKALNESKHLQRYVLLDQADHYYAEGTQHRRKAAKRVASFDTSVFFLENDAAKAKWKVEDLHIEQLKQAFMNDPEVEEDELDEKEGTKKRKSAFLGSNKAKKDEGKRKRKGKRA